jgi:hypothetical protein
MLALVLALLIANSDDPGVPPTPPPADCSIVDTRGASKILGFPVGDPDEAARAGGICFFVARSAGDEGTLTYAIVTKDRLPVRRAFYRATARRCAPAVKGTLNELACRQFIALAGAQDMDAYWAARASAADASPVPGLGDAAIESGNALYVHRGDKVFELSVLVAGDLDLTRTTDLANQVLGQVK